MSRPSSPHRGESKPYRLETVFTGIPVPGPSEPSPSYQPLPPLSLFSGPNRPSPTLRPVDDRMSIMVSNEDLLSAGEALETLDSGVRERSATFLELPTLVGSSQAFRPVVQERDSMVTVDLTDSLLDDLETLDLDGFKTSTKNDMEQWLVVTSSLKQRVQELMAELAQIQQMAEAVPTAALFPQLRKKV